MSRVIVFDGPGGPEALRLAEVAEPRPGPGQVRVRVRAAGVQPFDVAVVGGWLPAGADAAYPRTPGNEFAGVIDSLGEGVTGPAAGDEVLGFTLLNAYREHLVVPAAQVTAKPPAMPWEVAGGFTAPAQTAYNSLEELQAGRGDTLLVHGAAGAVGTVAVQLGRLWGATVIGAAREGQHAYLRSLGALPVAYGDGFADRVRGLAPDGTVTASLDGVGGAALDATLDLVRDRSRIITLHDHDRAAALGVRLSPARRTAARLAEMAGLYARGDLTWHVHAAFPLERVADAHRAYRAGGIRGKIVLTVD
ncbi:NADP-dependent oxidoreductase [Actinomadura graeca]|uniref:NADP-dependent oxidoreductase n=1 Tax=Actinomadura graeca TaxID=2750812 RepID=A0ABX8QPU7_9ACTN|nr:NADP-dependent oxidoreductase [Actinomadura graeca]QXJ19762.1 NADP-dependent oxidoreductase [Actinomadura graeca]